MSKPISTKLGLLVFMVSVICLPSLAKEPQVQSLWTGDPVQINGRPGDWADAPPFFQKKQKVDCAFKNDSSTLYILFQLKDPKFISSLQVTGLTVWYSALGKKKQNTGLNFNQKQASADEYIAYVEKLQGELPEEKKQELKKQPVYRIPRILVINKNASTSDPVPQPETGPQAVYMVRSQDNVVTFEMAIPLNKLEPLSPGLGVQVGHTFKIGFEWGGVTKEMKEEWMRSGTISGGQMTGGSMGRGGGGGAAADFSGGRGSGLTQLKKRFKRYSFWLDLQLAEEGDPFIVDRSFL